MKKKSMQEPMYNIDEIEDLTLFANESFDTQDVDLFEFSSEESSPLTRLKSIILSLDWEINNEILQELADELQNMQATWQGDKVAEVYLQGLEKIGRYIRSKGAYAHPNSIKLLLTFFYNFEKIVSSQSITGDEITKILKADIRKFKILQYQIKQSEDEQVSSGTKSEVQPDKTSEPATQAIPTTGADPLTLLKAAILSLDWEVTDDSLKQFDLRLQQYQETVSDNRLTMVLVQGLRALGDYIGEERADAHPEAFPLLHSFNDALEQIAVSEDATTDQSKAQDILFEQINRLNSLKLLIASPQGARIDEQKIDEMVGEISTPRAMESITEEPLAQSKTDSTAPAPTVAAPIFIETATSDTDKTKDSLEAELDFLFGKEAKPAMESAETQYPDEVLPPEAIQPVEDELADDLIEASLHSRRGLMPALSGMEETSEFGAEKQRSDTPAMDDLDQQLDMVFAQAVKNGASDYSSSTFDFEQRPGDATELEQGPAAALSDVELPDTPIVADDDLIAEDSLTDIASNLDSFFDQASKSPAAPLLQSEGADLASSSVTDESIDEELVVAALSDIDADIDNGIRERELKATSGDALDIESCLDSFFTDIATEAQNEKADAGVTSTAAEEAEQALFFSPDTPIQSALADSDESRGFSEEEALAALEDRPLEEIEEKLDFFFGDEAETASLSAEEQNSRSAASSGTNTKLTPEEAILAPASDLFAGIDQDEIGDVIPALASFGEEVPAEEDLVTAVAGGEDNVDSELEEKLDFFFSDETETASLATDGDEPAPVDGPQEIEAILALEDEVPALPPGLFSDIPKEDKADVAPALTTAFDESEEELAPAAVVPGEEAMPDKELDDELDFFFAAEENETNESVTETVSELTQALEATIDGSAPVAAALASAGPVEIEVVLASLGALLPGVVRAPAPGPVNESMRLLDSLQQQAASPEHRSLAQLLNSTVSLLGRTAGKDKTETEKLVNYLYEQLRHKEINASAVPEAVSRFSLWMQNLCATMPLVPEKAGEEREPRFEYTAKELYFELSELRASFRDELAKLRHEMHHRT